MPYAGGGSPPAGGYRFAQALSHPAGGGGPRIQGGGGPADHRHAGLGGGVLRCAQPVPPRRAGLVAVRHRGGGHAVAVAGAAPAGPGDAPASPAGGGHRGGAPVRLPDLGGSGRAHLVPGPGRAADPVGGRGAAGAGAGAAGLSPLPHHHPHHSYRQRGDLPAGGGTAGRPLAVPRLGAGLVSGGAGGVRGHGDPPDHHPPGALPAGGGSAALPPVKHLDTGGPRRVYWRQIRPGSTGAGREGRVPCTTRIFPAGMRPLFPWCWALWAWWPACLSTAWWACWWAWRACTTHPDPRPWAMTTASAWRASCSLWWPSSWAACSCWPASPAPPPLWASACFCNAPA